MFWYIRVFFVGLALGMLESSFAVNYFVNDGSNVGDVYTTSSGVNNAGCGFPGSPCATIQFILDNFPVNPEDTIFVDAGDYFEDSFLFNVNKLTVYGAGQNETVFEGSGGARWAIISGDSVSVHHLTLVDYELPGANGGTILFSAFGSTSLFLNEVIIDGGIADNGGGLFVGSGEILSVQNSTFENCTAQNDGGAIFGSSGSQLYLSSVDFGTAGSGNRASRYGGALHSDADTVSIQSCTFRDNRAERLGRSGGAIHLESGSNTFIETSTFETNTATNGNGGVLSGRVGTNFVISRSFFRNNQANQQGSVLYTSGGALLENCLVVKNNAGDRGAIVMNGVATLAIRSTTIADNSAAEKEGVLNEMGTIDIFNSIIYGHADADVAENGGTVNVTFSNYATSSHSGVDLNNIQADPEFVDPGADDYALTLGSPLINMGSAVGVAALDFDGNVRVQDGQIDMGAYEAALCDTTNASTGVWTWTGTVSTDWFDCGNWDMGSLPNSQVQVSIPGATPNIPLITGRIAYARDLVIDTDNGGIVNLNSDSGGRLNLGP